MKNQKMSLEKMKNVLNNVLSREEMKEVMKGSECGNYRCVEPNRTHLCLWDTVTQFCTGCGWFCTPI